MYVEYRSNMSNGSARFKNFYSCNHCKIVHQGCVTKWWQFFNYIFVVKTNLMHYLSLIYFVNRPLHVSGIFTAHHQEVRTVYVQQLVCVIRLTYNTYQLLYIYSVYLWMMGNTCPKHVEVEWRNKLRINSASSWFSLQRLYTFLR
jgi:hypothetical protein